MRNAPTKPSLSAGNKLYLYRLLKETIGTSKQTFATKIEEALEADDLAAESLGFANTRELLEELGDVVKLTVFKGGRVYATLMAQPEWDAALENQGKAAAKADASAKGKSWKKKKGGKTLKAQRPKHVKRPEPEPEPEAEAKTKADNTHGAQDIPVANLATEAETKTADASGTSEESTTSPTPEAEGATVEPETKAGAAAGTASQNEASPNQPTEETNAASTGAPSTVAPTASSAPAGEAVENVAPQTSESGSAEHSSSTDNSSKEAAEDPSEHTETGGDNAADPAANAKEPKPAITFTVVYDPDDANAGVHTFESNPNAAPADEAATSSAHKAAPQSSPASASAEEPKPAFDFSGYPVDFTREVFCPGNLLAELSALLPYGADALGIAGEYYWIARERGTIEAARNRASFALRYTRDGERHEATVRIRRNTSSSNFDWAIDKIESDEA